MKLSDTAPERPFFHSSDFYLLPAPTRGKGRATSGVERPCTNKLGARIRALRQKHDMTQAGLASYCRCQPNRVSEWEIGFIIPSLPALSRVAAAFGMTLSQLLDGVL